MHIETAPAKINLTLDVLYKRDDGYHEVEMVMTTIDLNDYLTFEKRQDDRIVLSSNYGFLPLGKKNLVYQAALIMQEYGAGGVNIHIDKNIPVSAGLGGGSADAAATFRGMNTLFDLNLDIDELARRSAEIGSDIPFCVYGGTRIAKGRGEVTQPLKKPVNAWIVLAKPELSVSTKQIYQAVRKEKSNRGTKKMVEALNNGTYEDVIASLSNDLQNITRRRYKKVDSLLECFKQSKADGVLMSGSGPTVYGICKKEHQATQLFNAIKGICDEVYKVRLIG